LITYFLTQDLSLSAVARIVIVLYAEFMVEGSVARVVGGEGNIDPGA